MARTLDEIDRRLIAELLTERLQTIDGIVASESFFVLEVHKMAYGWGVPEVAVAIEPHEEE
jgi:Lrp/AsnC family transcriptional regulator for asnA, asnC and gidA